MVTAYSAGSSITTDAVGGLAEIHDRMPLIVPERDWDRWLDPDAPPDLDFLAAPPSVDMIPPWAPRAFRIDVNVQGPK